MHDSLFVFDIETIPDIDVLPQLTGEAAPDAATGRDMLAQYHLKITDGKNAFPRQPFHKVVAISFLRASIVRDGNTETYEIEELRSGGEIASEEKQLIAGFFAHCGKLHPRLVSFNGRGFDLPVLKYRAMKFGVSARWLHQAANKWENYTARYAPNWHCDLAEVLSDYGASARIKMNEVCAALDLPGKTGVDGSQVADMYDRGEVDAIRRYCETDVLNTYLLYLRHVLHTGQTDHDGYNHAINLTVAWLEEQAGDVPAWQEFLEAWREASKGSFNLL
ncbi:MAG: 3'-5' exonuclease [Pseudomonadota bacterium]